MCHCSYQQTRVRADFFTVTVRCLSRYPFDNETNCDPEKQGGLFYTGSNLNRSFYGPLKWFTATEVSSLKVLFVWKSETPCKNRRWPRSFFAGRERKSLDLFNIRNV